MKALKKLLKRNPIVIKYVRLFRNGRLKPDVGPKKFIKGKGNITKIDSSAILHNCVFDIAGNNNQIVLSKLSTFNDVTFIIRGDNNKIEIAKNVEFKRSASIWVEDYNCEAKIDENSTFENVHLAITEPNSKLYIGKDCMFAYDIDLRTGDSHSIIDSTTNKRINFAQNINIGNHVWIGAHVSILKGVSIADNSIVATRAVVTKKFEDKNILIGGIPAKKIRENINWERKRIL